MNSEMNRILDLFKRLYTGGAWHGPSLQEVLYDVDAGTAVARLLPEAHSILELVRHIAFWQEVVVRRLECDTSEASADTGNGDWNPEIHAGAWSDAKHRLEDSFDRLMHKMATMSDDDLLCTVPGRDYTVYIMLHGLLQHTIYHAGQIAMLRKAAQL